MDTPFRVIGIAGSLRVGSYNKALLQAVAELALEGMHIEIAKIDQIPLYNQDIEMTPPQSVHALKEKIRAADAVILVTPEYNYSVSGVLKNAIDWGSRPRGENVWDGKPCALLGASPGMFGTARAQYHLRQIVQSVNMYALNRPEVMVSQADKKFDASLRLIDEPTREKIQQQLNALMEWTRVIQKK